MLTDLVVEGLGVIDRLEVSLGRGCVALTGETGAGKTLVVAALGLLLGDRADRSLLREGVDQATVEARFEVDPSHPAAIAAAEATGQTETSEVLLARTISTDGRSRARINGRMASAANLKEIGALLVEIAGQNQHQRLGARSVQREILDSFAGPEALQLSESLSAAVPAYIDSVRELERFESSSAERERQRDVLRFEIEEIEKAGVREGELEDLEREIVLADSASLIADSVGRALDAISSDEGAASRASIAADALESIAGIRPEIASMMERLRAVSNELDDLSHALAGLATPPASGSIDELRSRLEVLRRLERKYGGLAGYLAGAKERLSALEDDGETGNRLRSEVSRSRAEAEGLAGRLSELRREAAPRFSSAVDEALGELAMAGARFEVDLDPAELSSSGAETVGFLLSANPGEAPKPLGRVASGGELSRLSLAIHLLTSAGDVPTMVFDEVDAGVGGAAAGSVGRALADLARERAKQVIVVTHLPQVAAFADLHLRVTKEQEGSRTAARLAPVEGDERVAELSRMLAGFPDSESARDHARELLDLRP